MLDDGLECVHEYGDHVLGTISVSSDKAGARAVTSSMDSQLRILDLGSGTMVKAIDVGAGETWKAQFSPVMKFEREADGYGVYRMTHSGDGGWSYMLDLDKLEALASKYVRHVGTDELFELV